MPKDQTKEELNNGKIDKNSVIIDGGEKNEALDFLDYLETSNHPSAIKIRNLRQYLSDEELLNAYYNNIGTGVTKESLESSLEVFFVSLATHITELPNGIVIDLKTGLVDVDKSFEQALEVGIYSKDSVIVDSGKSSIEKLKEIDVLHLLFDELDMNYDIIKDYNPTFIDFEEINEVYKDIINKDENDMNLSDGEKRLVIEIKERIPKSIYEERPEVFEACQLYFQILSRVNDDDRQMKVILNERLNELMKRYPKLAEEGLPILDKEGNLIPDKIREMNRFIEDKKNLIMLGYFDRFNNMSADQISKLPKEERNKILLCAFSSQRHINSTDERYKELAKNGKLIIETICPELDLNNEKKLAEFFKKEMEYGGDISEISLEKMARISNLMLKKVTEKSIIDNVPTKKKNNIEVDLEALDFEYAKRKAHHLVMENYFTGSQIDFSEEEAQEYNKIYQNATVNSWLESKKNVMKLRYATLLSVREEYKKNPITTYVEKDLNVIEKEIKEFEEKYGKIDISHEKGEVSLADYKKNFAIAELTKYLTRDAADWSEGKNYSDLDKDHKKGYIKRILVALNNKELGEPFIEKIALRRLELMNSDGKKFIQKNENGEFEINKELVLEEYQEMFGDKYKYSSFEELMQSIKLREKEYVLEKLEEYANLPSESFKKLDDKSDIEKSMEKIEEIRYASNQKRIHKIAKNFNIKNDKDIIDKSIYERDMHLFEICKLQRELRDPKNVEHTQMYIIKLAEIKEFYSKYPKYRDMKLPILNEDGTLNDDEVRKMDQFSEAYQRIIIFEHLDKFNNGTSNINELSKKEREHLLLCAFAGLKYENSNDEDLRNLSKRCLDLIEKTYPDLNLENEKQLADFFKEKMGFDGKIENISLNDIIEITTQELKEATENYIEQDENSDYVDKDIDFSALDLDSGKRKIYTSAMKNYFVGSNIDFSEKDEKRYNDFYKHVTVDAWIDNKEDALKLRYMALNEIKKEYIKNPVVGYTEEKLNNIENDLKELEAEFGENNINYKKNDVSFEKYRKQFVYAGMTKYLTRDISDWNDGIDYSNLDNEHKKGYIRNILVALENKGKDTYLTKIALRRLELMNTDEKEFVKIYDNNKYEINKELILKEYKGMSNYEYSDYNDLLQSVKLRENEYILEKLKEYTKLNKEDFLKLDDKKNYQKSMEQIEKARYKSNQKRIHEMFQKEGKNEPIKEEKEYAKTNDTKDNEKNPSSNLLADKVFEESAKKIGLEEIITTTKTQQDVRNEKQDDQLENGDSANVMESELKKQDISVTEINDSAIKEAKEEKASFINKMKSAFESMKKFVERIVNKKENVALLEEGKTDLSNSNTSGIKATTEKDDFNSSIASGISLQEQQEYAKKQQSQSSNSNVKGNFEEVERS